MKKPARNIFSGNYIFRDFAAPEAADSLDLSDCHVP
jgi:hypothetical protein